MAWNAEGLKKKLSDMAKVKPAIRKPNPKAANALGGLSGNVVKAKRKRKKALEEAAKW